MPNKMKINKDLIISDSTTKLGDLPALTTDYIVERGNKYIKYNSGIIFQWGRYTYTGIRTFSFKGWYLTNPITNLKYPITMKSIISSSVNSYWSDGTACWLITNNVPSATQFGTIYVGADTQANSCTAYLDWFVVGTWK